MPHPGIGATRATSRPSLATAKSAFSRGTQADRRSPTRTLSWRKKTTHSTVETRKNATPGPWSSRVSSGNQRPWTATKTAPQARATVPEAR
jgi:hypothetical protein